MPSWQALASDQGTTVPQFETVTHTHMAYVSAIADSAASVPDLC
jgi:hypothetical protein